MTGNVTADDCSVLTGFLESRSGSPAVAALRCRLIDPATGKMLPQARGDLLQFYDEAIPLLERELWKDGLDTSLLELYRQLFQEQERHIAARGNDSRHEIVIAIPVADRPLHLRNCLSSLLQLCRSFSYGGFSNQRYRKITVLIADDSREQRNIASNRDIAASFHRQGLQTIYFGLEEQQSQLDRLPGEERARLSAIVGDFEPSAFYHKGASVMRNIAYLKLRELAADEKKRLFYFVDSDQEFKVEVETEAGDAEVSAVNYFYHLDRIFSKSQTSILTGKVVGDPPVSPAVMAGNFLEDIHAFLLRIANLEPAASCQFHSGRSDNADDASYHDMADLFGFKPAVTSFEYRCMLGNGHDHVACFNHFTAALSRFFDGEHPTRRTYYEFKGAPPETAAARTVYTGNYVFNPEGLKYFIPFASLKLRMAGPVLGRIIRAEIGARFVSANLPMLHKRTVHETGQSEFRPGINRGMDHIDLSGELERQYFGDVMLFAMRQLVTGGCPMKKLADDTVLDTVKSVEQQLAHKYRRKRVQIIDRLGQIKTLFEASESWWNSMPGLEEARKNLGDFISNVEHNFGAASAGYELVGSEEHRDKRRNEIAAAISNYSSDRRAWEAALERVATTGQVHDV